MGYITATCHPWPTLLFIFPLLVIYEGGVYYLGGSNHEALRNGADAWIRWGLENFEIRQFLAAPGLLLSILLLWSMWKWESRPKHLPGVLFGMALESLLFAYGLWGISRNFTRLLELAGIPVPTPSPAAFPIPTDVSAQILIYIGAGIYEEVLFRLFLFTGFCKVFRFAFVPGIIALPMAAIISSLLFALAHHIGPHGEPFRGHELIFLFRTAAGLYFALLFWLRGFGIAVGAHAAYDLLVGVQWK